MAKKHHAKETNVPLTSTYVRLLRNTPGQKAHTPRVDSIAKANQRRMAFLLLLKENYATHSDEFYYTQKVLTDIYCALDSRHFNQEYDTDSSKHREQRSFSFRDDCRLYYSKKNILIFTQAGSDSPAHYQLDIKALNQACHQNESSSDSEEDSYSPQSPLGDEVKSRAVSTVESSETSTSSSLPISISSNQHKFFNIHIPRTPTEERSIERRTAFLTLLKNQYEKDRRVIYKYSELTDLYQQLEHKGFPISDNTLRFDNHSFYKTRGILTSKDISRSSNKIFTLDPIVLGQFFASINSDGKDVSSCSQTTTEDTSSVTTISYDNFSKRLKKIFSKVSDQERILTYLQFKAYLYHLIKEYEKSYSHPDIAEQLGLIIDRLGPRHYLSPTNIAEQSEQIINTLSCGLYRDSYAESSEDNGSDAIPLKERDDLILSTHFSDCTSYEALIEMFKDHWIDGISHIARSFFDPVAAEIDGIGALPRSENPQEMRPFYMACGY